MMIEPDISHSLRFPKIRSVQRANKGFKQRYIDSSSPLVIRGLMIDCCSSTRSMIVCK
ncbi:hypothetical protein PO124_10800 [Bacillus licheniformis]|nr:hypothetical protein [Bacillus licheniformis]